jgi:Trk K+ transport system NAD-binding subunit
MDFMTAQIQKLEKLREELEEKEKTLTEMNEKYEAQSISKQELSAFKEDLESAGGAIEQLTVDKFSSWAGKTVGELECRDDILIGLIIHAGAAVIPNGDSLVEAGDRVVVLGRKEAVVETLHRFKANTANPKATLKEHDQVDNCS